MSETMKLKKATYNLTVFSISKLISAVGANILAFGISLYILKMTGSATSFSINMICTFLPRILMAPVAGYLADNYSKKLLVISSQIMIILTISMLLLYSEWKGMSIIAIYVTTVFYSLFGSFSGISLTAAIGNIINPERIQKAMSLNQMSVSIASIAAPIIGGILFGLVSIEVFLMIQIVAYTISTLLDSTMDFKLYTNSSETEEPIKEKMLDSMKKAITYISGIQTLKSVMMLSLWVNLFFSALNVGSSFILVEVVKLKPIDVGWVEAVGAGGMLLGSIYLTVRKKLANPLLFSKYSLLLLAFSLVLLVVPLLFPFESYTAVVIYFMIILSVTMIAGIFTNIPIGIVLQQTIEENYRGRVFALLETMAMGMMPIGSLVYGLLYDMIDAQYVMIITAVIIIGLTLFMLRPTILKKIAVEQHVLKESKQN